MIECKFCLGEKRETLVILMMHRQGNQLDYMQMQINGIILIKDQQKDLATGRNKLHVHEYRSISHLISCKVIKTNKQSNTPE